MAAKLRPRWLVPVGALLAAIIAILVVLVSGGSGHRVTVMAAQANYLTPGSGVRAAGVKVGKVVSAEPTRAGTARLVLEIDDQRAWPLPRTTKVRFRWGSTIAFSNRYVELDLPPAQKGAKTDWIPDGGTVAAANVTPTVELDQVFNAFTGPTRRNLRTLIDEGGPAVGNAGAPLRSTLDRAPPALDQANAVLEDLGARQQELDTLVRSTDGVVHAIQSSNPGVGQLVTSAATTFSAIGSRARQLRQVLAAMPPTLDTARTTLGHAGRTLLAADDLTRRLAPGVDQVRSLAPPLNRTLRSLVRIGPDARLTLATLRSALPDLNPLLAKARVLMPRIGSIGRQAATQLACIRPFSPEIAGFITTWTGNASFGDKKDKYFHANAAVYGPPASSTPLTTAQFLKSYPAKLTYAFPRPPGFNAGQPWFIPKCGVGPDTLDPFKDPESRR